MTAKITKNQETIKKNTSQFDNLFQKQSCNFVLNIHKSCKFVRSKIKKMKNRGIRISLRALWNSFADFVRKDFHWLSYCYTFLFVIICISINYQYGFYKDIIRPSYYTGDSLWIYPLLYLFMYFAVAIPVLLFQKEYRILRSAKFYLKAFLFVGIYGVITGFYVYNQFEFPALTNREGYYILRLLSQFKVFCFLFVPILLMRYFLDKDVKGLYGLCKNTQHVKAYLILFLMLLPFLLATSFTPDFLKAYPQFRPWLYDGVFELPTWLYTSVFELVYSLDFIMVELIFRGVLVIGMMSVMGTKAVLPMIVLYASIHFGKPPLETLSSIFGGYILGAFAYETKHIWGGVIVHIFIALTMEIMGILHYYLK